jgi:hypothetical protein
MELTASHQAEASQAGNLVAPSFFGNTAWAIVRIKMGTKVRLCRQHCRRQRPSRGRQPTTADGPVRKLKLDKVIAGIAVRTRNKKDYRSRGAALRAEAANAQATTAKRRPTAMSRCDPILTHRAECSGECASRGKLASWLSASPNSVCAEQTLSNFSGNREPGSWAVEARGPAQASWARDQPKR